MFVRTADQLRIQQMWFHPSFRQDHAYSRIHRFLHSFLLLIWNFYFCLYFFLSLCVISRADMISACLFIQEKFIKISFIKLISIFLLLHHFNYWIHIQIHFWKIVMHILFYQFEIVFLIKTDRFRFRIYCYITTPNFRY